MNSTKTDTCVYTQRGRDRLNKCHHFRHKLAWF